MPDGSRKRDKWLRVLMPMAYFCMFAAGILLFISDAFAELGAIAYVMGGFLVVGGAASLWGSLSEKWVGEFVGLPLLASSFAVFGVLQAVPAFQAYPLIALANLLLLWSVADLLMGRWRQVKAVSTIALHVTEKERRWNR